MAYPVDTYNGGTCPTSHPVHLVGLFYEMYVPTQGHNYWGEGAYVLSTGDPTGLAFHGDFQNGTSYVFLRCKTTQLTSSTGWDVTVLQNAVDNCHNMNGNIEACQVLVPYIDQSAASACTIDSEIVNENVQGPFTSLPGCNPVQIPTGIAPTCTHTPTPPGFAQAVESLEPGWIDVGCIAEGTNGRALTGATTTSPNMTANWCAKFCQSHNFVYAGVEYGDECYCGNSFSNGVSAATVGWEECNIPCAGNCEHLIFVLRVQYVTNHLSSCL